MLERAERASGRCPALERSNSVIQEGPDGDERHRDVTQRGTAMGIICSGPAGNRSIHSRNFQCGAQINGLSRFFNDDLIDAEKAAGTERQIRAGEYDRQNDWCRE